MQLLTGRGDLDVTKNCIKIGFRSGHWISKNYILVASKSVCNQGEKHIKAIETSVLSIMDENVT